jgi:hypothetical protein
MITVFGVPLFLVGICVMGVFGVIPLVISMVLHNKNARLHIRLLEEKREMTNEEQILVRGREKDADTLFLFFLVGLVVGCILTGWGFWDAFTTPLP